jgi:hypothetical protein
VTIFNSNKPLLLSLVATSMYTVEVLFFLESLLGFISKSHDSLICNWTVDFMDANIRQISFRAVYIPRDLRKQK